MKEKEHLAVVAPDIINAQGHHQNPLRENAMTLKGAYKNLIYNRCLLIAFKIPVLNKFLYQIDKKRSEKWFDNYYRSQKVEYREDIVPHGAFVIYFPKWIQEENQAFPCHTFMYLEEDFLKSYCDKKNYLIKYKIIFVSTYKNLLFIFSYLFLSFLLFLCSSNSFQIDLLLQTT